MPKFNYGVFIGRFAPIHDGHVKVMMEALEKCDYLIVVVGSDNVARNTRTPFTAEERIDMIRLATNWNKNIFVTSVGDYPYNETLWLAEVQNAVNRQIKAHELKSDPPRQFSDKGWHDYPYSIALAGMHKDETSYYLNMFPQWSNSIAIQPGSLEGEILSSTGIRNFIFNGELAHTKNLHPEVKKFILEDMENRPEVWDRLRADWNYEQKYESLWGRGPHITVDTAVIQAGHILLIQRGTEYGHGLWALPGGFINRRERITNAAIRELKEETKLKVPEKVLFGSITAKKVYDDPFRSNRSHIITHCHKIVLENVKSGLPEVYGSDDAEKAKWVPLADLGKIRGQFFEDHESIIYDIINS